jgi:hypothetical protein
MRGVQRQREGISLPTLYYLSPMAVPGRLVRCQTISTFVKFVEGQAGRGCFSWPQGTDRLRSKDVIRQR